MPKLNPSIFQKLRVSYWILTGKKGFGLVEHCGVCGSSNIVGRGVREKKETYMSKLRCRNCGAVARVKEKWRARS